MGIYRITNITHTLGKRNAKYNSILDIAYVEKMMNKIIKVKPNDSVYLTVNKLPLSVHRLRVKKLVTVVEISKNDLKDVIKAHNIQKEIEKPKKIEVVNVNKATTTSTTGVNNSDGVKQTKNKRNTQNKGGK